jgi:preprotein translocase subunit YajC
VDGFLFVLLAMVAIMYLLLIRPQRQQQRRHTEMIENLKPGDEVITAGGIYGDVTEIQADRVSLEIAEDVEIEVAKRAIASVVPPEESVGADDDRPAPDAAAEPESEEPVREEDAARR